MIHNSENEIQPVKYENFNQKFLINNGVSVYFGNVFLPSNDGSKLPMIKSKLRKILVDFGMCQTCLEINQELDYIKVYFRDELAKELKGTLLYRYNQTKESQTIGALTKMIDCCNGNIGKPKRIEKADDVQKTFSHIWAKENKKIF